MLDYIWSGAHQPGGGGEKSPPKAGMSLPISDMRIAGVAPSRRQLVDDDRRNMKFSDER